MTGEKRGVIYMLLCAALWSIAGIFIKQIPWNPMVIAGGRGVFTVIIIGSYMLIKKMKLRLNANALKVGIPMALLATLFVLANKLTTAANAVVLQYTSPVFVILLSALIFHKKPSALDVTATVVTFGGIALFFIEELSGEHLFGNIVAILSGVVMAVMYMYSENVSDDERMSGLLLGHGITVIIGLIFAVIEPPVFTAKAVACISILGVFQLGIPYVLYGIAAGLCPSLACALLATVEPLLNPLWVFIFDGEAPGLLALSGGVIVIAAVTVWTVMSDRRAKRQKAHI